MDITIPANQTTGMAAFTFNFNPSSDNVDEGNETVVIGGTSDITVNPATLTITDDPNDNASTTIQLSTTPGSINENGGKQAVTVTARLQGNVSRSADTVVTLNLDRGSAGLPGDDGRGLRPRGPAVHHHHPGRQPHRQRDRLDDHPRQRPADRGRRDHLGDRHSQQHGARRHQD